MSGHQGDIHGRWWPLNKHGNVTPKARPVRFCNWCHSSIKEYDNTQHDTMNAVREGIRQHCPCSQCGLVVGDVDMTMRMYQRGVDKIGRMRYFEMKRSTGHYVLQPGESWSIAVLDIAMRTGEMAHRYGGFYVYSYTSEDDWLDLDAWVREKLWVGDPVDEILKPDVGRKVQVGDLYAEWTAAVRGARV